MKNPLKKMIARRVAAEVDAMRAEFEERLGSMVEHVLCTIDFPEIEEMKDSLELLRDDYEAIDFAALESAAERVGDFEDTLGDFETRLENVEAEGASDREKIEQLDDRVTGWADEVSEMVDRVEEIRYDVNGIEHRLTEAEEITEAIDPDDIERRLESVEEYGDTLRDFEDRLGEVETPEVEAELAELAARVENVEDRLDENAGDVDPDTLATDRFCDGITERVDEVEARLSEIVDAFGAAADVFRGVQS